MAWQLYVDESGDFDLPGAEVCVAGFLVPGEVSERAFESALRQLAGAILWPLHAAHYNLPVFHALVAVARPGEERRPAAEAAVAFLSRVNSKVTAAALRQIRSGKNPRAGVLRELNQVLDAAPTAEMPASSRAELAAVRDEFSVRLKRQIAAAGEAGCLVVVAGEAARGDAGEYWAECASTEPTNNGSLQRQTQRYFGLLGVCVERAADVVGRRGSAHLEAIVAVRDVVTLGRALRSADLGPVLRTFGWRARGVNWGPPVVAAYGPEASPFLVAADFVANRSYRLLSGRLAKVEKGLESSVAIAVRSGAPGLSHLAASGLPGHYLGAARCGDAETKAGLQSRLREPVRAWACEQAREWADYLGAEAR